MTEMLDVSNINIPYGILHDQKLKAVHFEDNKLIMTFDTKWFSDYDNNEFVGKYKGFINCDMVIELAEKPYNMYTMQTSIKYKTNKFKCLIVDDNEITDLLNNSSYATFISAYSNGCEFIIELDISFYECKGKYKRYKKYSMCYMHLDAKTVSWKWY